MLKKTIQINPELFKLSGGKKKTKKKKLRPKLLSSSLKPNQIKKQLIARVKEHHKKKKKEMEEIESQKKKELDEFQSDFNESLNYLNSLSKENEKKKKEKKERRSKRTRRKEESMVNDENIDSFSKSRPDVPYGIMKHGKKQLYSQYRKTLKRNNDFESERKENVLATPIKIEMDNNEPKPDFSIRQNKLNDLKVKLKNEENIQINDNVKKRRRRKQKTKRLIRKVTLGKNKKNNTIGILIKNRKTRKKIENEYKHIQKSKLSKIKSYLRQHNLIKIGSAAPEDLLRPLYENAYLSGDIINKNPEILLHNYMGNDIMV
tara:strand:+ start:295 stop:1248 length:954 start_codon:yes stop_codon:yes gene_type:complete